MLKVLFICSTNPTDSTIFHRIEPISESFRRVYGITSNIVFINDFLRCILEIPKYDVLIFSRYKSKFLVAFKFFVLIFIARIFNKIVLIDIDDLLLYALPKSRNIFAKSLSYVGNFILTIVAGKLSHAFVVCSPFSKKIYELYNSRVVLIPTPHICGHGDRVVASGTSSRPIIGWIAGHPEEILQLKDVFVRLAYEQLQFQLFLVHAGNKKIEYEFKQLPINVYFGPSIWLQPSEICKIMRKIDIFIYPLPNYLWYYGKCSARLIDAMSLGKACIASKVGANVVVIRNGYNGFLANDINEWYIKLRILITNSAIRQKFSENAIVVSKKYCPDEVARSYLNLILKIMKSNRNA